MASYSQRLLLTTSYRRSANFRRLYPLPILAGVSSWVDEDRLSPSSAFLLRTSGDGNARRCLTTQMEEKPNSGNKKKDQDSASVGGEVFDITKQWKKAQNEAQMFWESSIFTNTKEDEEKEAKEKEEDSKKNQSDNKSSSPLDGLSLSKVKSFLGIDDATDEEGAKKEKGETISAKTASSSTPAGSFQEMATSFASILTSGGSEASVQRIVKQARQAAEEGDVADKTSNEEVMAVLTRYAEDLKKTADRFLGDVDFSQLYPSSLFYFIEHSDSIKTPSWKRQRHRFYPGIDIRRMEELNDHLQLADLSYADSVESIQEKLENNKTPYEVVYVNTESKTNRPAHFIAVKRSQKLWTPWLEVIMVVRGTKTIDDAITDLLCDYEDYKGGKAHSGMLEGGRYLAEKHKKLFKDLLKSSGKPKLSLTLVGHSLGAGAASIVAMEYYDEEDFECEVIGFGCPAMLSKELSEQTKHYITTVVADDDCVPRLSAASVVNALLDIMEYDYIPYARRDVKHALSELQRLYPMIVTETLGKKILELLDPLMDQYVKNGIKKSTSKRMDPLLFPPGNIIHFYRDGVGVTGSVVPCDFFEEVHVSRRMLDE